MREKTFVSSVLFLVLLYIYCIHRKSDAILYNIKSDAMYSLFLLQVLLSGGIRVYTVFTMTSQRTKSRSWTCRIVFAVIIHNILINILIMVIIVDNRKQELDD